MSWSAHTIAKVHEVSGGNTWLKGAGGIPKSFRTDNGKEFTTHMARQLYNKLEIHFTFWWAENHQSNPIERFHRTLHTLINSLRVEGEDNFIKCAKAAVMLYNGAPHSSTGVTSCSRKRSGPSHRFVPRCHPAGTRRWRPKWDHQKDDATG